MEDLRLYRQQRASGLYATTFIGTVFLPSAESLNKQLFCLNVLCCKSLHAHARKCLLLVVQTCILHEEWLTIRAHCTIQSVSLPPSSSPFVPVLRSHKLGSLDNFPVVGLFLLPCFCSFSYCEERLALLRDGERCVGYGPYVGAG